MRREQLAEYLLSKTQTGKDGIAQGTAGVIASTPEWLSETLARSPYVLVAKGVLRGHRLTGEGVRLDLREYVPPQNYEWYDPGQKEVKILYLDAQGVRRVGQLDTAKLTFIKQETLRGTVFVFLNPPFREEDALRQDPTAEKRLNEALDEIGYLAARKVSPKEDPDGNGLWSEKMEQAMIKAQQAGATMFSIVHAYFGGTPASERQPLFERYWSQGKNVGLTVEDLETIRQVFRLRSPAVKINRK